jgi:hypothetical protein
MFLLPRPMKIKNYAISIITTMKKQPYPVSSNEYDE